MAFLLRADRCRAAESDGEAGLAQGASSPAPNRLIHAASPYLLLHAHNPVDWYPWGPEALEKAKREHKPIFLSVGYSTCYWCHVAEKTIYSDPAIARLMNEWFVNIKVDREERPDLDRVYMLATQLLTGHGGWPNNVFLTPDLKPIFAGSYFPPKDEPGRGAGFPTILKAIHEAWTNRREQVLQVGEQVRARMEQAQAFPDAGGGPPLKASEAMVRIRDEMARHVDPQYAGRRDASGTKFPMSPHLSLLLQEGSPQGIGMLRGQLDAMAFGGIHDHLAGGFHRYATEATWSIPHFEKMLYDNAQLLGIYLKAHQATGDPLYRRVAEELADYLSREMTEPEGGFYSAQDAEVEGREGASYLWTEAEIEQALGKGDAEAFLSVFELRPLPVPQTGPEAGQPSAGAVLRLRLPLEQTLKRTGKRSALEMLKAVDPSREKLLAIRNRRKQPLRDEKIVTGPNGLAIEAFARIGSALHRPQDLGLAKSAAERIWRVAFDPKGGRLHHQIWRGQAHTEGFLDDYALLGRGYLALFEATQEPVWRQRAVILADALLQRFARTDGSLKITVQEDLLVQPQEFGDDTQPSGVSAAVDLLLHLSNETGNPRYRSAAEKAFRRFVGMIQNRPEAWPSLVLAMNSYTPAGVAPASESLDSSAHVRASAERQGQELVVTLRIAKGYHINANPATQSDLVATRLELEGVKALRSTYPKAMHFRPRFAREELDVYTGRVKIRVLLPKNTRSLKGTLTVQACTDQLCLAPAKLPISVAPVEAPK